LNATDADITLLAPLNSAFPRGHKDPKHRPPEEFITKAILYHIVAGTHKADSFTDGQLLDTGLSLDSLNDRPQKIRVFEHKHHVAFNFHSRIAKDDIKANNGLIQAVNHVLIPPPNTVKVLRHFPAIFGVLLAAVKRADLGEALATTKGITLFAPTNRAFKKLGVRKLKYLFSRKGKETLKKILTYHVSSDLAYGPDLREGTAKELPTLQGEKIKLEVKDSDPEHGHKHKVVSVTFCTSNISGKCIFTRVPFPHSQRLKSTATPT